MFKKKRNLFMLVSAIALIVGYRLRRGGSPSALLPGPSSADSRPKTRDVLGKSVGLSSLGAIAPGAEDAALESKCGARWLTSANMTLADFHRPDFFRGFLADTECAAFDRRRLRSPQVEALFAAGCTADELNKEKLEECQTLLSFYRASIIGRATEAMDPKEMSAPALMNGIIAFFGSQDFGNVEKRERAMALTDELIRKEPGLYGAKKAKAALYMFSLNPQDPASAQNLRDAVAKCRESGQADNELLEGELVSYKIMNDDEGYRREINQLLEREPRNSLGHYFQASVLWNEKNKLGAIAELEKALSLNQSDERVRTTLEKVRSAEPGAPHMFSMRMTANFEDL